MMELSQLQALLLDAKDRIEDSENDLEDIAEAFMYDLSDIEVLIRVALKADPQAIKSAYASTDAELKSTNDEEE